jgi:hypothetical protein
MADIDQDVHALKEWLRAAWGQLGEPSLTSFARQELRIEIKRCSEDLRHRLRLVASPADHSRRACQACPCSKAETPEPRLELEEVFASTCQVV